MRRILQFIGKVVFFCAWPAFWVYYKVGWGRTRVIVQYQGKVLVMKQWISLGKWALPGGGRHKGESAGAGVVRELYEETGVRLNPKQLKPIGTGEQKQYGLTFNFDIFEAKVRSDSVRPQRLEISELAWVDPDHLTAKNAGLDTLYCLETARRQGLVS